MRRMCSVVGWTASFLSVDGCGPVTSAVPCVELADGVGSGRRSTELYNSNGRTPILLLTRPNASDHSGVDPCLGGNSFIFVSTGDRVHAETLEIPVLSSTQNSKRTRGCCSVSTRNWNQRKADLPGRPGFDLPFLSILCFPCYITRFLLSCSYLFLCAALFSCLKNPRYGTFTRTWSETYRDHRGT